MEDLASLHHKIDRIIDRIEKDHDVLIINNQKLSDAIEDIDVLFVKNREVNSKMFKYAGSLVGFVISALGLNKLLGM